MLLWYISSISPRMNSVSTDWLLQECQLHVKAACSRWDNNESLTNCSASSWCVEMSATSGLMFHAPWQSVVLSSVIAEISPGIFIPIFTLLQTVTLTLSQHGYTEWHLVSSPFHQAPSTDKNHIHSLLHQLLHKINEVKKYQQPRCTRPLKKMRLVFIPATGLCTNVILYKLCITISK